ncbi:MAG TPA: hypothetical protein VET69_02410, partial [Terriglobales bacterium]|nr:hypothetical protein [Terriglobales bacterium]
MRTTPFGLIFSAFLLLVLPSGAQKNSTAWTQQKQFGIYTEIPGASRVGAEQCATCHSDQSRDYQHAFHSQQGVQCEDCHGYGSKHVEGGGDVSKIISFIKRPPSSANGVCLSCHARDAKVRYWTGGSHSANRVRCIDCHQVHAPAAQAAGESHLRFDTATSGAFAAESAVPETNVVLRPPAQTNEACIKCHQAEKAQLSLPYHHPLREG